MKRFFEFWYLAIKFRRGCALKKSIILILFMVSAITLGCVESTDPPIPPTEELTETEVSIVEDSEGSENESISPSIVGICKWDWSFDTTDSVILYSTAPQGHTYAVVSIYLKNEGDQKISTNPENWTMIVNGIEYSHSILTYNDEIGPHTVDVLPGGEYETKIVYEISEKITEASLLYSGHSTNNMERIDYFNALAKRSAEPTEDEKLSNLLNELNDAGYEVTSLETYIEVLTDSSGSKERVIIVFNIPEIGYAQNFIEMSLMAFESGSYDAFMVNLNGEGKSNIEQSYWIPKSEIVGYNTGFKNYNEVMVYESPNPGLSSQSTDSMKMWSFLRMID